MTDGPEIITRHRHELKRRELTVTKVEQLTPHMLRLTFHSEDLADFTSLGFDDHIKLFFPVEGEKPAMRDYTPRAFDREARLLVLDFALHQAGPATAWAAAARPGDTLQIGGPRGSSVINPLFEWWLLIGDETALPAIGRKLEEMEPGPKALVLGVVPDAADQQVFTTAAGLQSQWVIRPEARAADPEPVLEAVRRLDLPPGPGFIWIAAEAKVARALRDHFLNERGHPRNWIKAAGYWTEGLADGADKSLD